MIQDIQKIEYKGRVVFEKITMSPFKRIPKLFQENEACFMFIKQGEFSVRTPDEVIEFDQGKGLLSKCFNYFFELSPVQRDHLDQIEVMGILLYPEMLEDIFQFELASSSFSLGSPVKGINIDPLLVNYRESISILLDHPELADEALIRAKVKEFVLLVSKSEQAPSELDFLSALFQPISYEFRTTIEQNVYASLSINELAKLCNMSLSTFKRKFASIYSESPKTYLLRRKMEKAVNMLSIPENRIIDIAYSCGFESLSSFNRNFKQQYGQSPSSYRLAQNA
ncbi:MAG: helix-turn-helix transcriptional regulator [Bacteroidota bacterium]